MVTKATTNTKNPLRTLLRDHPVVVLFVKRRLPVTIEIT
jgi:hypothetical protein